jgi:hypothetical protein
LALGIYLSLLGENMATVRNIKPIPIVSRSKKSLPRGGAVMEKPYVLLSENRPRYSADDVAEAEYLIHGGDHTLGGFFEADFTEEIWGNEAAVESMKLIWPDMTKSRKVEIAMTVCLGFVAGMIFSGRTGAVLTTEMRQLHTSAASSQEVANA